MDEHILIQKIAEHIILKAKENHFAYDTDNYKSDFPQSNARELSLVRRLLISEKILTRSDGSVYHFDEKISVFLSFEDQRNQFRLNNEIGKAKMWYEMENAKIIYEDYPRIKKQAFWAILISAIATAIALATAIVQLTK